jgi:SAM-dependent methyltransferase
MTASVDEVLTAQAAAYVRGRPDYPAAIEGWLTGDLGLGEGKIAVDLGSGTGKFLPRLKASGAKIIAIEPLPQMRSHLVAIHPDIDAREGRAQALPLADGSVDAVTCAMCFHLFATHEALAEIRRVLKPGGALGLLWNIRDPAVPWVADIIAVMAIHDDTPLRYESQEWRTLFPAEGFTALRESSFANPQTGSPGNVIIDRILSVHAIARLPSAERDGLIARVRDVIAASPDLAGREKVTFPNVTYAYSCRKTD